MAVLFQSGTCRSLRHLPSIANPASFSELDMVDVEGDDLGDAEGTTTRSYSR